MRKRRLTRISLTELDAVTGGYCPGCSVDQQRQIGGAPVRRRLGEVASYQPQSPTDSGTT